MIDLTSAIEAILFAAGDSVPLARLSLVLGVSEQDVETSVKMLQESYAQQQRLRRAATHYLARNRLTDRSFRFDLITLEGDAPPFVLHHYRNVFHTTPPNYPLP